MAGLPVVFEVVIEVATSQGDDGIGSADSPEHAGQFEAEPQRFLHAASIHTGADEEVLMP